MAYLIGLGGCVTILALHVILAYLRKTERVISAPPRRIVATALFAPEPRAMTQDDLADPRVAKIISEIPRRRIRQQTYAPEFAPVR